MRFLSSPVRAPVDIFRVEWGGDEFIAIADRDRSIAEAAAMAVAAFQESGSVMTST